MIDDKKPFFLPLKKEYFFKFLNGEQDCEIRPFCHRAWNTKNIYLGRRVTLSNGYGKYNRITKTVHKIVVTGGGCLKKYGIAQWHIDAVESIYGHQDIWMIAYMGD